MKTNNMIKCYLFDILQLFCGPSSYPRAVPNACWTTEDLDKTHVIYAYKRVPKQHDFIRNNVCVKRDTLYGIYEIEFWETSVG